MQLMLDGIALEAFKRGLTDEFLYAISVQEPATLDDALQLAKRIETDMKGASELKGALHFTGTTRPENRSPTPERKTISFQDPGKRYWDSKPSNNSFEPKGKIEIMRNQRNNQETHPGNRKWFQHPNNWQYPNLQPIPPPLYNYYPYGAQPIPLPYNQYFTGHPHGPPYPFQPQPPTIQPNHPQISPYRPPNNNNNNLNGQHAPRTDGPTSDTQRHRPAAVKFLSAEELAQDSEKDKPQQ